MATVQQVQNVGAEFQDAIRQLLQATDRLKKGGLYYNAFGLSANDSFPENAFAGTSLEARTSRDGFRTIVSNALAVADAVDAVPGRREVLTAILDGVP